MKIGTNKIPLLLQEKQTQAKLESYLTGITLEGENVTGGAFNLLPPFCRPYIFAPYAFKTPFSRINRNNHPSPNLLKFFSLNFV